MLLILIQCTISLKACGFFLIIVQFFRKMYEDLVEYRTYNRLIDNMVYIAGIWPHYEHALSSYRLITYSWLFVSSVVGTKLLIYGFSNISNVMKMTLALRFVVTAYASTTRIANCLAFRKKLAFLDEELGAEFEKKLKNEKNQPILLKNISLYSKFMYFLIVSTTGACLLYLIPVFILNLKHKKRVPILVGKYPFPVEPESYLYWIVFILETSMFASAIVAVTGVDNAFGRHCFRISGLLRLAAQRFEGLDLRDPENKDQLRECVSIHQLVNKAKTALQSAYGVIIMWNYVTSAIVMCTLMWQVDQVKRQVTVWTLTHAAVYISVKLVQCFIYAYYGASITIESENFQKALYTCKWPGSGNVKMMKELLIISTQRTISLKACGYFLITMEFFEKICTTTISYFFLLQSIDAKHH